MKQLAKVDLLYIDDFGLAPLADQSKRDLLEILEDRYDKKSLADIGGIRTSMVNTVLSLVPL